MLCEMCGKFEAEYLVEVEGAVLRLCSKCSKYGKVIRKIKERVEVKKINKPEKKVKKPEPIIVIVDDYAQKIKRKREELGMNQKQFAKLLNEKESVIHHIETGKTEPSIKLAKKIEKILKIKLIEEVEIADDAYTTKSSDDSLTLGDIINIK